MSSYGARERTGGLALENASVVLTSVGRLQGSESGGVRAFKGIPYGAAVSGSGRWRQASKPLPWTGIRDALSYGPRAVQIEHQELGVTSHEIEQLLLEGQPADPSWQAQSEDCLTLNVWAPAGEHEAMPVMVWLHGGGYHGETPSVWWFDGECLARRGRVVVVTVRHRVGPLGFLHLADLSGVSDCERSGNIGMVDIVQALDWVRDEIGAFGGNAGNVTLFGESGGGTKISVLLATPSAKGLFSKAIIQSGPQLPAPSRDEGTATTLALLAELGLAASEVHRLWGIPAQELTRAQARLMPRIRKPWEAQGLAGFQPIVDNDFLPSAPFEPYASEVGRDVPLIIGTCATEASFLASAIPGAFELEAIRLSELLGPMLGSRADELIAAYAAARPSATPTESFLAICTEYFVRLNSVSLAERKQALGGAPVYMYLLAFGTDVLGGKLGTPHTMDIPLVFAHPDQAILGTRPGRHLLVDQMASCWAAFAYTGDPNCIAVPYWPPYDMAARKSMVFDLQPQVVSDPQRFERLAWGST